MRHVAQNCVAPCICIDTIKNNRNYTVQISFVFFLEDIEIIHSISLHFF